VGLDEAFDLGDPDLWKSNSFAALKPRLIVHVEAVIASCEGSRPNREARIDRAKAIYRKLTGAEWAPRPSKMSQLKAQFAARTAKQEGEAAAVAGEAALRPEDARHG
jgi:hypothetical protein